MHRLARTALAPAARAAWPPCTCSPRLPPALAPQPAKRRYAAPATRSFEDQVLLAARRKLEAADSANEEGSIDAARRSKELEGIRRALRDVEQARELIASLHDLASSESDPDLRDLALADVPDAEQALSSSHARLVALLAPAPATSSLGALVELKAGVGGSEASLWSADLVKMYQRLSQRKGWRATLVESVAIEGAGVGEAYKEALLEVTGEGAFGYLRREAGVHRVQRVPATESKGRVHSSTVSVIVLPAASDADPSADDGELFEQKDVRVETMRSRGAGGQHVNRTESAIRLTHIPTGITVSMQDSRSQHDNRTKAYRVLRARLLDRKIQADIEARRSLRRTQIKGVDRSEKIRTYNLQQVRLTDHRIPLTTSALEDALQGGETLDMINDALEDGETRETIEDILAEFEAER
ncbi:hypothetical protein Rhopal_006149-T1 [Rhodotorula paludigena]|uniref:Prokaryotic-type class I peptide chain release factors domain-containing protein n=1 Tax=Rhodotorula paludigena TaxID=86838 RepID=A0AAV5GT28_9BASI|nr:hypothetical protein Rhopal_006149-T1 [Rhodotorula paludigena]